MKEREKSAVEILHNLRNGYERKQKFYYGMFLICLSLVLITTFLFFLNRWQIPSTISLIGYVVGITATAFYLVEALTNRKEIDIIDRFYLSYEYRERK